MRSLLKLPLTAPKYRRMGQRPSTGSDPALLGHYDVAVRQYMHFHPGVGVYIRRQIVRQLQDVLSQLHRAVLSNSVLGLEAKDIFQTDISLRRPIDSTGGGGTASRALKRGR